MRESMDQVIHSGSGGELSLGTDVPSYRSSTSLLVIYFSTASKLG